MNINTTMSLCQLADLMGDTATEAEAEAMRDLLVESGHDDTNNIGESEWCQYLCQSVEVARAA